MTDLEVDSPFYVSRNFLAKVLRLFPNSPKSNQRQFKIFLYIWLGFWGGPTLNNGVLFIYNLASGNYEMFTEDFSYLIGHIVAMLSCYRLGIDYKKWSHLIDVVTEQKWGKPPNYEKVKRQGEFKAKLLIFYLTLMLSLFTIFVILDEKTCELAYQGKRICGLLDPTWWPKTIQLTGTLKRMLLIYQMLAAYFMSGLFYATYFVLQSNEFIVAHVDHLMNMFEEICASSPEEQFGKFKEWVNYHRYIIEYPKLCETLNVLCIRSLGLLSVLVPVTLACLGYQMLLNRTLKGTVYILGFLLLITVVCHTGEKMQMAMTKIGTTIYLAEWQKCDWKIQQWLPFVLAKTQRPNGLDVVPIGRADHVLLLMMLKATYSYLTLLKQTM